jgi:hypothetical protein
MDGHLLHITYVMWLDLGLVLKNDYDSKPMYRYASHITYIDQLISASLSWV